MHGIDPVVKKETKYMAALVIVLSAVLQAVFLVLGRWDLTVLLGNLLSAAAVVGNFFAMAMGVQRAVNEEEKQAKQTVRVSNAARMFAMFIVLAVGVAVPVFNTWAVVIPFVFPRLIVAIRPLTDRANSSKEGTNEK